MLRTAHATFTTVGCALLATLVACSSQDTRDLSRGDGAVGAPSGDGSGGAGEAAGPGGDAIGRAGDGGARGDADTTAGDGSAVGADGGRCSSLPPAPKPSTVIDLANKGLKPGDSIDSYLKQYFKPGNEVIIPAGSYRWGGSTITGTFGKDAILRGRGGQAVLRAPDNTAHNGTVTATGSAHVRILNLTLRGTAAKGKNRIAFQATSKSARIEIINVRHPDGSPHDGYPAPMGFYVRSNNVGDILFRDCYIARFPNNGLYISDHHGRVVVDGCVFESNNTDNLRLDGNDVARNVLILMRRGTYNYAGRGIRFRYPGSPKLQNVHIVNTTSASPIQTGSKSRMSGPVKAALKDVYIDNAAKSAAIDMQVGSATADNVQISGSGSHATIGVTGKLCNKSSCTAPLTDIAKIRAARCAR